MQDIKYHYLLFYYLFFTITSYEVLMTTLIGRNNINQPQIDRVLYCCTDK